MNTADITVKCLRSIQKEIGDISFEVILVDNGSIDTSVKQFNKLKKEDFWKTRLSLILNHSNEGYAKANNQGIKMAGGQYVLLLNNDTIIHNKSIQNLVDFADRTSDAGVVGAKLINADGTPQMSCYNFPTVKSAFKEYWLGAKGLFEKFAPIGNTPQTVDSVVGAVFLVTPTALKRIGLLDERYFAYFEDIDYCRQVWKKGLKVYYLPKSIVTHYHGATFKQLSTGATQWRKLIPSSKIYHGLINHYIIFFIMWTGQKFRRLFLGYN